MFLHCRCVEEEDDSEWEDADDVDEENTSPESEEMEVEDGTTADDIDTLYNFKSYDDEDDSKYSAFFLHLYLLLFHLDPSSFSVHPGPCL